jgi:hypothetical protein
MKIRAAGPYKFHAEFDEPLEVHRMWPTGDSRTRGPGSVPTAGHIIRSPRRLAML